MTRRPGAVRVTGNESRRLAPTMRHPPKLQPRWRDRDESSSNSPATGADLETLRGARAISGSPNPHQHRAGQAMGMARRAPADQLPSTKGTSRGFGNEGTIRCKAGAIRQRPLRPSFQEGTTSLLSGPPRTSFSESIGSGEATFRGRFVWAVDRRSCLPGRSITTDTILGDMQSVGLGPNEISDPPPGAANDSAGPAE